MTYTYRARPVRVVDGDSLILDLDLGFYQWRLGRPYRLGRINAPELREEGGPEAQAALAGIVSSARAITVATAKSDSFDRWICEVVADGVNVSDELVRTGHATYQAYR